MYRSTDVVIIGGGVIGCLTAYRLRQQGLQVIVVERGNIGGQASTAAAGLLAPFKPLGKLNDPYLDLQRASLALFPQLVEELESLSGFQVEYQRTGTLRIALRKQKTRLEKWTEQWGEQGVEMNVIQGEMIQQLEPALAPKYELAVVIPCEPQIRSASFMQAVALVAKIQGAHLQEQCQIINIEHKHGRAIGVQMANGVSVACGHIVVASGAWSGEVGRLLGLDVPVQPLQGQSILLHQPTEPVRHILFGEGIFISPKADNTIIIGATREDVGFNVQVTDEGMSQLSATAQKLIPALADMPILASWAGLRPRTLDNRPLLGLAPGWENVSLATGHNGFGILLSAITAQETTRLIISGRPSNLIQPFTLARYSLSHDAT